MHYPKTFAAELYPLEPAGLGQAGNEAVEQLLAANYEVVAGVRRDDVKEIAAIARQNPVREYCAKDALTRCGDEEMMAAWFDGKKDGRGVFLLRHTGTLAVAGYGWTGPELCQELPESLVTLAVRLDEGVSGQGLGVPFTTAILYGSMALYGARNIGLETWGSNTAAVKTYLRAGADLVTTKDDVRPTLQHGPHVVGGKRQDVRLYMQFPQTF